MTQSRILRSLIKSGAAGNSTEFRRAAEDLIREEREKKHHILANDLEGLLSGVDGRPVARPASRPYDVPHDRERNLALIEMRDARRDLGDIVLSDENRAVLDQIVAEQARAELLATHGLCPATRVLFWGPPGCGKTTAAEVLASELDLDLAVVRFDAIVSSFLGETSANLRRVFDFLARERVVALFDEFDAIGKSRGDESEHGELKRVVNAFLQMMDAYRGRSVLLAATNHERLLDRALWRRFDEVAEFDLPTTPQTKDLLRMKLRAVRHDIPIDDARIAKGLTGFTHADVERVVIRAIKTMVLAGRDTLTEELFEDARRREAKRLGVGRKR